MCEKCSAHPENRNTRYCDDWWDDIYPGGYKSDRRYWEEKEEEKNDSSFSL